MRTTILAVVCVGLLVGCDKGTKAPEDDPAKVTSPAPAGEAPAKAGDPAAKPGTPAATTADQPAATPPAASTSAACQAACEHRQSCNVPGGDNIARCVEDCTMLSDHLTAESLTAYTKASCAEVTQGEAGFQTAALCRRACRHRTDCIPDADATTCEAECAGVIIATAQDASAVLTPYLAADCTVVKSQEAGFQVAGSCLRLCAKAIECSVRSELKACLGECVTTINDGKADATQARALAAKGCDDVRAQIARRPRRHRLLPPGTAPGSPAGRTAPRTARTSRCAAGAATTPAPAPAPGCASRRRSA